MAKPDSRPRLERHAINIRQVVHSYLTPPSPHVTHTHTNSLLSQGLRTGPLHNLNAEVQNVGWASAWNKERKKERKGSREGKRKGGRKEGTNQCLVFVVSLFLNYEAVRLEKMQNQSFHLESKTLQAT